MSKEVNKNVVSYIYLTILFSASIAIVKFILPFLFVHVINNFSFTSNSFQERHLHAFYHFVVLVVHEFTSMSTYKLHYCFNKNNIHVFLLGIDVLIILCIRHVSTCFLLISPFCLLNLISICILTCWLLQ